MSAILLQLSEDVAERAHKVRFGFGAGINPNHREAFGRRFGVALVEAWSMTETRGAVTTTAASDRPFGAHCTGQAHQDMEFRLVNDASADVASGELGELLLHAKGAAPRRGFAMADRATAGLCFPRCGYRDAVVVAPVTVPYH